MAFLQLSPNVYNPHPRSRLNVVEFFAVRIYLHFCPFRNLSEEVKVSNRLSWGANLDLVSNFLHCCKFHQFLKLFLCEERLELSVVDFLIKFAEFDWQHAEDKRDGKDKIDNHKERIP